MIDGDCFAEGATLPVPGGGRGGGGGGGGWGALLPLLVVGAGGCFMYNAYAKAQRRKRGGHGGLGGPSDPDEEDAGLLGCGSLFSRRGLRNVVSDMRDRRRDQSLTAHDAFARRGLASQNDEDEFL